ncbi:MAG: iron ABC transporter permease [Brevinematia bacterium]
MKINKRKVLGRVVLYASILSLGLLVSILSFEFGTTNVSFIRSLIFGVEEKTDLQILRIRVLQSFAVLLTGIALAISGFILQRIMRNNLVDPGITGVLSGSALGVTIFSVLSIDTITNFSMMRIAFSLIFGLLAGTVVMLISAVSKDSLKVVIFGVMLNSFLSGTIVLIQSFLNPYKLQQTFSFLLGSVVIPSNQFAIICGVIVLASAIGLIFFSKKLDIISLGDIDAHVLGINIRLWRSVFLVFTILLSSTAVSLSGVVGFVGFVIPNIVSLLFHRLSFLDTKDGIILSGIIGGTFLQACFVVSRILLPMYELPIGIITGLIGAPIFWLVLLKMSLSK